LEEKKLHKAQAWDEVRNGRSYYSIKQLLLNRILSCRTAHYSTG